MLSNVEHGLRQPILIGSCFREPLPIFRGSSLCKPYSISRENGEGQGWGSLRIMRKGQVRRDTQSITTARKFRKEMSLSEKVLWNDIRDEKLGFKFRRQHSVGEYFLDFYCAKAKLIVEVDGEQHQMTQDHDFDRDQYFAQMGILTMRIPSLDVWDAETRESWLYRIRETCRSRTGAPP
ncbi:MAG: endonuclease domain-containing protein [Fimbriimonas sp.]